MKSIARECGFSLVELIIAVSIAAMLLIGLQDVLRTGDLGRQLVDERTELAREARFALERITSAVQATEILLIPMSDDPTSPLNETIREQTVPASAPPTGSTYATAVLALGLGNTLDLDGDGIADADNDGDGLVNEDYPADIHNDGKAGVRDFDDDGNGIADFFLSPSGDDDESGNFARNEDPVDGEDNDGDGSIDEDPGADINNDGAPGLAGVDDDGDGSIDEGDANDDDEDGSSDEDWIDVVVFYLSGSDLIERRAVPWDENNDSVINGRDFLESVLAQNLTHLRFERVPHSVEQRQLVDVTLGLRSPSGESISINTRVRLGGAQ